MLKKALCWFILFCSISAYRIHGLGKGDRVLDILGLGAIICFLILYVTYQGTSPVKAGFKYHIIFIFIGTFLSAFMAKVFHSQDMSITVYQQRAIYFLLFYFLLHYLLPNPRDLEKMIMVIGLLFCLVYIVQTKIYPTLITDAMIFRDRGTLRIFMPGGVFMVLAYYLSFKRIFEKFNWLPFSILILTGIVALLLAGRQLIISLLLISFVNILIDKRIKNKLALIFLFVVVISAASFFMRDTINDMISVSQKHSQEGENYIRFRAVKYFLFEFPNNKLSYIFGNGTPSERSVYGISLEKFTEFYGFYMSDIGIIGTYFKYGSIFVIAVLAIFIKILFSKLNSNIIYIKNFIVSTIITMFTTEFLFDVSDGIVAISILLYIIDYNSQAGSLDENFDETSLETNELQAETTGY
jgi:hypothetical protein